MEGVYDTISQIMKDNKMLFSPTEAFDILNIGCLKKVKFQDIATAFNKGITLTMERFFFR